MKFILLFGFFVAKFISNGVDALEAAILIGGERVAPGEFGYHVAVRVMDEQICGGAILDDYHVLTAAHCVGSTHVGPYRLSINVVAGTTILHSPTGVKANARKIFVPKAFTRQNKLTLIHSDIAVLQLDRPLNVSLNPMLSQVELPKEGKLYAGQEAVTTGFGWDSVEVSKNPFTGEPEEQGHSHGRMRYANTKVFSQSKCQGLYKKGILEVHVCAQVNQRHVTEFEGVCTGDSGGPLVHKGKTIIGVLSSSPIGCTEAKKPAIYTRVSSFLDFINKALNDVADSEILTAEPIPLPGNLSK